MSGLPRKVHDYFKRTDLLIHSGWLKPLVLAQGNSAVELSILTHSIGTDI